MITHLHYEDYLDWVPAISLAIVFGVCAFTLLWLWRMKPNHASRAANLPLEDESSANSGKHA